MPERKPYDVEPFFLHVVGAIVSRPDEVTIVQSLQDDELRIRISVAKEDLDKLLGNSGRTLRALQSVVMALGKKYGLRPSLDITAKSKK